MLNRDNTFIEVDHFQISKHNQSAPGDVFYAQKNASGGRIITTLSDGLGSGIKAGVLATLTSTMITNFILRNIPVKRSAEIIMNTLPVSKDLGISYATFTAVDIHPDSVIKIIEYDNPQYILIRGNSILQIEKQIIPFERTIKETGPKIPTLLYYSTFNAKPDDRIIFFSDGVTQSGMGNNQFPFGWGRDNVQDFILATIQKEPEISARELSRMVVFKAHSHDNYQAKDDISCQVIYFRNPRNLLVMTGPPWKEEEDATMANIFKTFDGKKIICGGTTAKIIARELDLKITIKPRRYDIDVPPESEIEGVDLATEGIITLAAVAKILENGPGDRRSGDPAVKMTELFLDCDRIHFVIGTKINDANYDPEIPVELEIRRTVVRRIAELLEKKHLKEVHLRFF
jgi:hypothetical protein